MDTILPLVLAAGRAYLARESALASDPLLPVAASPPRSAPRPSGASAATRAPTAGARDAHSCASAATRAPTPGARDAHSCAAPHAPRGEAPPPHAPRGDAPPSPALSCSLGEGAERGPRSPRLFPSPPRRTDPGRYGACRPPRKKMRWTPSPLRHAALERADSSPRSERRHPAGMSLAELCDRMRQL